MFCKFILQFIASALQPMSFWPVSGLEPRRRYVTKVSTYQSAGTIDYCRTDYDGQSLISEAGPAVINKFGITRQGFHALIDGEGQLHTAY
jgi:hypothetical protein